MSKYVDEIIKSMDETPEKWRSGMYAGSIKCLYSDTIMIYSFGNVAFLSILSVEIMNVDQQTTWWDRAELEWAIRRWFQKISLKHLTRT